MFTHTESRNSKRDRVNCQFSDRPEGKSRKFDRRAAIARKNAFLIDGLTVRAL